jgi:superfamily II DNA or RNA helicase
MLITSLLKSNSKASVLIVVPTEFLKEQWIDQLIEWDLIDNCKVEIINTVIKSE